MSKTKCEKNLYDRVIELMQRDIDKKVIKSRRFTKYPLKEKANENLKLFVSKEAVSIRKEKKRKRVSTSDCCCVAIKKKTNDLICTTVGEEKRQSINKSLSVKDCNSLNFSESCFTKTVQHTLPRKGCSTFKSGQLCFSKSSQAAGFNVASDKEFCNLKLFEVEFDKENRAIKSPLKELSYMTPSCPFCVSNTKFVQHLSALEGIFSFQEWHDLFQTLHSNFVLNQSFSLIQELERKICIKCNKRKIKFSFCSNCCSFFMTFANRKDYFCLTTKATDDICCCNDDNENLAAVKNISGNKALVTEPENALVDVPSVSQKKCSMRVLSLFDGIATGVVALKQLGIQIDSFVASEIDKNAIQVVANRHPEVKHIGDITNLSELDVCSLGSFDLLLAGSPCNDLSGANPRRKGLIDPKGTGCLFFDFYRILQAVKPACYKNLSKCINNQVDCSSCKKPFFWLFENVASMKKIEKERISRFLCCQPVKINAIDVSAAARPRLFWGNIPNLKNCIPQPLPEDHLTVQDCLEPGRIAAVEKLNTITSKKSSIHKGTTSIAQNGKNDFLWSTEIERVFGVPPSYTDVNNLTAKERQVLLCRSWSVPVVREILKPLKDYFQHNEQK